MRWEGPGSGFENSSGGAGAGGAGGASGVWKSKKIKLDFFKPLFLRVFEKIEPAFFKTSFFAGF